MQVALAAFFLAFILGANAQDPSLSPVVTKPAAPADSALTRPLPDISVLMHRVEENQRKAEAIEKDYIFHSVETQEQTDSHGRVKKTSVNEYDHYWSEGVPVQRKVRVDGKDLSPSELVKEDGRIRKDVERAHERVAKARAEGKAADARGTEVITVSRLLELGRFTNARRVQLHGRDTIVVDYEGDPGAKTRSRGEEVIRALAGTAWIDEIDGILVRVQGEFTHDFKVGAGLLFNIRKGTRFFMEQKKINDEVWRPQHVEAQGAARALLFVNFSGTFRADYSGYRKLRTSSVVLPGASVVGDPAVAPAGP